MDAVHATVFPFDGEGAAVADVVQGDDDFLEMDVAMAEGTEIPIAAGVGEIGMAAEYADGAVAVAPPDVFHVGVEDAVGEFADEFHVVHALIAEVRGIVVEAEARMIGHGLEGAPGGGDVEGDLGGMDFEGEVDVFIVKHVEDGQPAFGEIGIAFVEEFLAGGREGIQGVPDGGAGKAVNDRR